MLSRFRKARDEQVELNLTPIMNLFVAMIPFLLMCASFYTVSVVNASQPVASPEGDSDLAKGDDKVTLAVEVRRGTGYKITAQSDTIAEATLDQMTLELPKNGVKYDTAGLSEIAEGIKKQYPKSDTAMILCDTDVFYENLVEAMDAVRERIERNGDEEVHHILFPVVVVSVIGAPAAAPAGASPEPPAPAEGG